LIRIVILLSALVPPFLVLGYGIAKTRTNWRFEPMWNAFMLGAVGALVADAGEFGLVRALALLGLGPVAHAAAESVFIAAIPEEAIKFFLLVGLCETHVDVRRLQDLLVLALAVSLGFATVENAVFVTADDQWGATALLRAVSAVPAHGINGLAMGALLIAARLQPHRRRLIVWALAVPIALHAAYDFPVLVVGKAPEQWWFGLVWFGVVLISLLFTLVLCNRVLARALAHDRRSGRDGRSVEPTGHSIVSGAAMMLAGPVLAAATFWAQGSERAGATTVLGLVPVVLGIDLIRTGLQWRKRGAQ
jgi:RsiW-degrading membrane proteinase PrsW (M82 family)